MKIIGWRNPIMHRIDKIKVCDRKNSKVDIKARSINRDKNGEAVAGCDKRIE